MSSDPCGCDQEANHTCDGCTITAARDEIARLTAEVDRMTEARMVLGNDLQEKLTALSAEHERLKEELRIAGAHSEAVTEEYRDRWQAAEAALAVAKGYVTHKADCPCAPYEVAPPKARRIAWPEGQPTCTCGAAAVLSQKGPSEI